VGDDPGDFSGDGLSVRKKLHFLISGKHFYPKKKINLCFSKILGMEVRKG
jgi:hypothetical protein